MDVKRLRAVVRQHERLLIRITWLGGKQPLRRFDIESGEPENVDVIKPGACATGTASKVFDAETDILLT